MRTTYTKPNSHTQQQVRMQVNIIAKICLFAEISFDDWLGLMFESGCQYMEMLSDDAEFVRQELQEEKYGFWAWWLSFWIKDDADLFRYGWELSGGLYVTAKERLMLDIEKINPKNEKIQDKDEPGAGCCVA